MTDPEYPRIGDEPLAERLRTHAANVTPNELFLKAAAELERLTKVATVARDVLTTLHEHSRDDIDFRALHRSLIEAGLVPLDPADWTDGEIPVPPGDTPRP